MQSYAEIKDLERTDPDAWDFSRPTAFESSAIEFINDLRVRLGKTDAPDATIEDASVQEMLAWDGAREFHGKLMEDGTIQEGDGAEFWKAVLRG
jgi:hypothetical protein